MIHTAAHTQQLADAVTDFVHARCRLLIDRYLPALRLPGYFAGQRVAQDFAVDVCVVLSMLHAKGFTTVGDRPIVETVRTILSQLDGATIKTFYSYRLADVLLHFGGMTNNPVLQGLDPKQIQSLAGAVDSTSVLDLAAETISGYPNNYWAVLARCEHSRSRLGLLTDDSAYKLAVRRTRELMTRNPLGYYDDDPTFTGRYDIYSAEVPLFVEPVWDLLGRDFCLGLVERHVRLMESLALPNGACVAWGRSIGSLSVCMTAELAATSLRYGMAADPARSANLVRNSLTQLANDWLGGPDGDLVTAHRHRMTDAYRGTHRLLQLTFDTLLKMTWTAQQLAEVDQAIEPMTAASKFPPRDEFIPFENDRHAGVWMFRRGAIELQVPLVSGYNADYAASPHAPGLFENAVDSGMYVGVPRASVGGKECVPVAMPASVKHADAELSITGQAIRARDAKEGAIGRRDVTWRANGDQLVIHERWTFDTPPEALSYAIAESATPLLVEWKTASPHSATVVNVEGMHGCVTAWSELQKIHEIDLSPTTSVELTITITPAVSVVHGPASHDYNRGMYDRMPSPGVIETGFENGTPASKFDELADRIDRVRMLHIGWPEHLFAAPTKEEALALHEKLATVIRKSGAKVVWTMHNRRPHYWDSAIGVALYRLWAPLTDVALHHSRWSIGVMTGDYPFRPDCRHEVIPHGHFGHQMQSPLTRQQAEEKHKLPPTRIRFGLLGRYQPEKQIEMLAEAFHRAGRADQQLVITAYDDKTVLPDDPRIIKLPREKWMTRQQIAEHLSLCDGLLAAQTGDTYLTSGLVGDAVGVGAAMIVNDWAFFREIAGDAALYHDNTVESLTALLSAVTPEQIAACKRASLALQPAYDWKTLSPKVHAILRSLRQ